MVDELRIALVHEAVENSNLAKVSNLRKVLLGCKGLLRDLIGAGVFQDGAKLSREFIESARLAHVGDCTGLECV